MRCGLAAVPGDADVIVVHDGARPFASTRLYEAVIDAVRGRCRRGRARLPVTDTIKVVDDDGAVVATPDRAHLVAVQTPQAFAAARLRAGARRARRRAPTTPRWSRPRAGGSWWWRARPTTAS